MKHRESNGAAQWNPSGSTLGTRNRGNWARNALLRPALRFHQPAVNRRLNGSDRFRLKDGGKGTEEREKERNEDRNDHLDIYRSTPGTLGRLSLARKLSPIANASIYPSSREESRSRLLTRSELPF